MSIPLFPSVHTFTSEDMQNQTPQVSKQDTNGKPQMPSTHNYQQTAVIKSLTNITHTPIQNTLRFLFHKTYCIINITAVYFISIM
jgi:hypothetical protein